MTVRFLGRSVQQVEIIDAWWREHRPSAPNLFAQELEQVLRLLTEAPEIGSPYGPRASDGVRRLVLERSRFVVYYAYDREREVVAVLAVWGARRGRPPSLRFFKARSRG